MYEFGQKDEPVDDGAIRILVVGALPTELRQMKVLPVRLELTTSRLRGETMNRDR